MLTGRINFEKLPMYTNWRTLPGSLNIQATGANPAKSSSPTQDITWYRRLGENLELRFTYEHRQTDPVGSFGSGDYLFTLPGGLEADSDVCNITGAFDQSSSVGYFGGRSANNTNQYVGVGQMFTYTATQLGATIGNQGGIGSSTISVKPIRLGSGLGLGNSIVYYQFYASVPIRQWKGSATKVYLSNNRSRVATMNTRSLSTDRSSGAAYMISQRPDRLTPNYYERANLVDFRQIDQNSIPKGTTNSDNFTWRRIGDSMEIWADYSQTSAGASVPALGPMLVRVPENLTIDTQKITASTNNEKFRLVSYGGFALWDFYGSTSALQNFGIVIPYNSNNLAVRELHNAGNALANDQVLLNADLKLHFHCVIPITEWRST